MTYRSLIHMYWDGKYIHYTDSEMETY